MNSNMRRTDKNAKLAPGRALAELRKASAVGTQFREIRKNKTMAAFSIIDNSDGDAVVEAAILFPIMIMVFAALVLFAIYLPTRAALQRATQYAATALSTEKSDTWLLFDERTLKYEWETDKDRLEFVYTALFSGVRDAESRSSKIVTEVEGRGLSSKLGGLTVTCSVSNWLIYTEITVTATREFTMPAGLSFIGFPETLPITVTSTAVVQNGDEFIRNMDIAVDFVEYIAKKFKLTKISDAISSGWTKAGEFVGFK